VEDLHGRLELVLGEADDVGVGAVAEDDGLLLQRAVERADVVAQPGRAFVLLLLAAFFISISRRRTKRAVEPPMKSQKSSTMRRCSSR
jgi:hypothetical protein